MSAARKVLWYVARPSPSSRDLSNFGLHTPSCYTFATLAALRDKMVPMLRRLGLSRADVEVWQSIGPHNAVLIKQGEVRADRRVSWYRAR